MPLVGDTTRRETTDEFINRLLPTQQTGAPESPREPTEEFIERLLPSQEATAPMPPKESTEAFLNRLVPEPEQPMPSPAVQKYIEGAKPVLPKETLGVSKAGAFALGAGRAMPGALGGLVAAGRAIPLARKLPWYGKIGVPFAAALAGGEIGNIVERGIERAALSKEDRETLAKIEAEQPGATAAGAFAAQALGMRPSIGVFRNAAAGLKLLGKGWKIGESLLPRELAALDALQNVAFGGIIGTGLEAARQLGTEGKLNLSQLAAATIVGAGLNKGWGPVARLAGISEAQMRQMGELARKAMGPTWQQKLKLDPARFQEDLVAEIQKWKVEAEGGGRMTPAEAYDYTLRQTGDAVQATKARLMAEAELKGRLGVPAGGTEEARMFEAQRGAQEQKELLRLRAGLGEEEAAVGLPKEAEKSFAERFTVEEVPPREETPNAIQEGRTEPVPEPVRPEVQQEAGGAVLRDEGVPARTVQEAGTGEVVPPELPKVGKAAEMTLYHGSTKAMKGAPTTSRSKESIKTRFGEMRVVGTVFDGFFLAKTPEYASTYSAMNKSKVRPFHLAPDAKVLSMPDIVSEEVLTSRGMGRSDMSALPKPTQPFPFQAQFEDYAFQRLNQDRQKNGREPFTREQFDKRTAGQWNPASKEYDLEELASKYLPDFIKAQGYDAVEMGREVVVLNPAKVVPGEATSPMTTTTKPPAPAPKGEKAGELMTPEEWVKDPRAFKEGTPESRRTVERSDHAPLVEDAIEAKRPVLASNMDRYTELKDYAVRQGYVREGDRYVFKGKPAPAPVPDALHAGTTVRPPKGATFARVTTEDGKSSVVSTRDLDTLAGAGPYQNVEFGIRDRKGNFKPLVEQPATGTVPPEPDVTARSTPGELIGGRESATLRGRMKAKGEAGFFGLFGRRGSEPPTAATRLASGISKYLRSQLLTTRRLIGQELLGRIEGKRAEQSAIRFQHRIEQGDFDRTLSALRKAGLTEEDAMFALNDVVKHTITPEQMAASRGISPDDPTVQRIREWRDMNDELRTGLSEQLKRAGASDDLVTTVLEQVGYSPRILEMVLAGRRFKPDRTSYHAAIHAVESELQNDISTLLTNVSRFGKKNQMDMVEFLKSGDDAFWKQKMGSLSPEDQERASHLGQQYRQLQQLMTDITNSGGDVVASGVAEAIQDAAKSTVDMFLNPARFRGGDPGAKALNVGNLMQRHLSGVWLALAKELKDATISGPMTTEVRSQLLTNLTFFNKLAQDGGGKWYSQRPMNELGHTVQLGTAENPLDRIRFGRMAGMWVDPNLKHQLVGRGTTNAILQAYYDAKAGMRLLKLAGVRTVFMRNWPGNLALAFQNGDYAKPGYFPNVGKAHKLLVGLLRGDRASLVKMKDYVQKGVFDPSMNSMVSEVEYLLNTSPANVIKRGLEKLARFYGYVDAPWKIAAYETELARNGGNAPAAVEHVAKFYQRPDRVPEFGRTMSKLPLSDFPVYFVDSMRTTTNSLVNAIQEAQKGNLLPALGWVAARGLHAATTLEGIDLARRGINGIKQWFGVGKDQQTLDRPEQRGLRRLMPRYYKRSMTDAWFETNPQTGKKEMKYAILSGVTPFAPEDLIVGALQASGGDLATFAKNLGEETWQQRIGLGQGMFDKAAWQLLTGRDVSTGFSDKGLQDVLPADKVDWITTKKVKDRILNFGMDYFLGQYATLAKRLARTEAEETAGMASAPGSYKMRRETTGDILTGPIEPVRVYTVDSDTMKNNLGRAVKEITGTTFQTDKEIISQNLNTLRLSGAITSDAQADSLKAARDRIDRLGQLVAFVKEVRPLAHQFVGDAEIRAALIDKGRLSIPEADAVMAGDLRHVQEYTPKVHQTEMEKLERGKLPGKVNIGRSRFLLPLGGSP